MARGGFPSFRFLDLQWRICGRSDCGLLESRQLFLPSFEPILLIEGPYISLSFLCLIINIFANVIKIGRNYPVSYRGSAKKPLFLDRSTSTCLVSRLISCNCFRLEQISPIIIQNDTNGENEAYFLYSFKNCNIIFGNGPTIVLERNRGKRVRHRCSRIATLCLHKFYVN